MGGSRRASALVCGLMVGVVGAAASPAGAYTTGLAGTTLTVSGAPGEINRFDVEDVAGGVLVSDLAQNPVTGAVPAGCATGLPWELVCDPGVVAEARVLGGDRNDTLGNGSVLARVTLDGGAGNDELSGGAAPELLAGGAGDDTLIAGAGADALDGEDGADLLVGSDGDDTLAGGAGDDRLDGSDGIDRLAGGAGRDVLSGGSGNDDLDGGDDADELSGDDGADRLAGGAGSDVADGGRGNDAIAGGDGTDQLSGGDGADGLEGGEGADLLVAGTGNDSLLGGAGADRLLGGEGVDGLAGGDGDDDLDGGDGADALAGDTGNDTLAGGDGADTFAGGDGADVVTYAAIGAPLRVTVGGGADDGTAGEHDDVTGDVEQVVGGSGDDVLTGSAAAERLDGGPGDDVLDGGAGTDTLVGGEGSDTVSYATRLAGVAAALGGRGGEPGEGDTLDASLENLQGGAGADDLTGSDVVANILDGGPGDDVLHLADATTAIDRGFCGDGRDRADSDTPDVVAPDCELLLIDGRQVRPPAPVPVPRLFLGARVLFAQPGRLLRIPARCGTGVGRVCAGRLRLALGAGGRSETLGRADFRIAAGSATTILVRLTPRALRRVRRAGRQGLAVVEHLTIKPRYGPWVARDLRVRVRVGAAG